MERLLLGIDVGTSGTKTMLFSEGGELLGSAYRPYACRTPQLGWSEQDPEDWWRAVCETVREVCRNADAARVAAISLSLQGGTVVPVDGAGTPLRPAMVWNDSRCTREQEEFLQTFGSADCLYETTGWQLMSGLPLLQLRWLQNNEPDIFAKAAMFLTVPDYLSRRMTGIAAADLSDAGINQLCDIRRGCYDEKLLSFAGVTEAQLPRLVHTGQVIGPLTAQAAAELGLTTDTVLVAGAHDQYAVATGAGMTRPGDMLIGSGTSWVVTALSDRPSFAHGLSQSVSGIPGLWGSLLSLSSGGVCLDWLRRLTAEGGAPLSYDTINTEAACRRAAEDGLFFYPFTGLTVPSTHFRKASLVGLDLSHDRYHLARAVMEGVAFQIGWMAEAFPTAPSADGVKLSGGAARSPLWCQILADVLGLPVRVPEIADLACVGAAIQAGVGCGVYADPEEGCRRMAVAERVVLPDPAQTARYAAVRDDYRRCAGELGGVYQL